MPGEGLSIFLVWKKKVMMMMLNGWIELTVMKFVLANQIIGHAHQLNFHIPSKTTIYSRNSFIKLSLKRTDHVSDFASPNIYLLYVHFLVLQNNMMIKYATQSHRSHRKQSKEQVHIWFLFLKTILNNKF